MTAVLAVSIISPLLSSARTQDPSPEALPSPDAQSPLGVQPPPQPCDCVIVPPLIIVDIEIMAPLSSATSKDGDTFPIRLASPVFVDGREVIAAGVIGIGEVVHAQKSGMGGGGGELLLAARYLEIDGRRLRLRSFRAGRYGKNQTGEALAASFAFGVFGLAVKGKNTEIAAGTIAEAKVAEAFSVPLALFPHPRVTASPGPDAGIVSAELQTVPMKEERKP